MRDHRFSKECKNRGFIKCGKSYMRVVGDGVFQHILLGFKERLDSSAPEYSQTHRYEQRILIYLKSMYAQYDNLFVSIDHTTGFTLNVPELLDKQSSPFMGAAQELERMLNEGFAALDMITEQHQLIEYLEPVAYGNYYDKYYGPRYSTQLYDIYLYCEDFYKARMAIETEFAHNYFATMSKSKRNPNMFSDSTQHFLENSESYYERYMLTAPVHYEASKKRLQNNYKINSSRLKALGIPLG